LTQPLWQPGAARAALEARATLYQGVRAFFTQRGVLEVETPLLCRYGVTDAAIEPLTVSNSRADGRPRYLQSSPEFAMKRLLAANVGSCYQIAKAFRDGECGRRHNPEFTMLEWYRVDWDYQALMQEVADLLAQLLPVAAVCRISYQQLFLEQLDLDPLRVDERLLHERTRALLPETELPQDLDASGCLDLLFSIRIEPGLTGDTLWFVQDWPASQAALAEYSEDGLTARRFEVFWRGLELANGYQELCDPREQARRHAADNRRRAVNGQPLREADPLLAAALDAGLPPCSGVAMGLDRVLMLQLGAASLDEVLSFAWARC
jgi:lysyl-tRNA synthetase class 2